MMKQVTSRCALFLFALVLCAPVKAQTYPTKPIRLVSAFAAGGSTDLIARAVAEKLQQTVGWTAIVDPKPGASGLIAASEVAKAAPDGHTVLASAVSMSVLPSLYKNVPFQLFRDITPVAMVGTIPYFLVTHPSLPVNSVQDLIAYARANPGKLNYGSGGAGTVPHLNAELLRSQAGLQMTHVAYKSGALSIAAILSGEIQFTFEGGPAVLAQVQAGKLKMIAVATLKRLPEFPNLPTVAESGFPGFEGNAWIAFWIPAATPAEVRNKFNFEVARVLRMPDVVERFRAMGVTALAGSEEEGERFIRAETVKWAQVIKASGATAE